MARHGDGTTRPWSNPGASLRSQAASAARGWVGLGKSHLALRGARRAAPVELIGFDADPARFVDATGQVTIDFADVTRRGWEP
jgi:hypothetical protein